MHTEGLHGAENVSPIACCCLDWMRAISDFCKGMMRKCKEQQARKVILYVAFVFNTLSHALRLHCPACSADPRNSRAPCQDFQIVAVSRSMVKLMCLQDDRSLRAMNVLTTCFIVSCLLVRKGLTAISLAMLFSLPEFPCTFRLAQHLLLFLNFPRFCSFSLGCQDVCIFEFILPAYEQWKAVPFRFAWSFSLIVFWWLL